MGISLQLYSMRDIKEAPEKLLKQVADMGYTGVEMAGYYDLKSGELKKLLDDNGLAAVGTHLGADPLRNHLEQEMDFNLGIGNHRLVCAGYKMDSFDDVKRAAELFSEAAEKAKKLGVKIGYHNHAYEFEIQSDGRRYIDVLKQETSPDVFFEFDVYWVSFADADPLATIKANQGCVELMHLKELSADLPKRNVEIGSGKLDFATIIKAGQACGTKEFIVEQEAYTMPVAESCQASFLALKKLNLI